MEFLTDLTFLRALAAFNTVTIGLMAGAAFSMYFIAMPIVQQAAPFSTRTMLHQFHYLITMGARYLQTGSRVQGVTVLILIYCLYTHPDPEIASRWKYFAATLFTGVQVAWYEAVTIFPTNDRLVEMKHQLDAAKDEKLDLRIRPEALRLMESWLFWHVGRMVIPLACVVLSVYGLMF